MNSIYNFCLASGGGVVGAEGSVGGGEAGGLANQKEKSSSCQHNCGAYNSPEGD